MPLRTAGGHGAPAVMAPIGFQAWDSGRAETRDDGSPTMRVRGGPLAVMEAAAHAIDTSRVRRLTPVECARLQGFPDDWNDWLPDSQRYRQYGNAVAVPVVEWLGRRLTQSPPPG